MSLRTRSSRITVMMALTGMMALLLSCTDTSEESTGRGTDPLPSWNEGASKTAILNFVKDVTTAGSQNYVEEKDRIAVFDNDGTLWSEKPFYFQLQFALDMIKMKFPSHPDWAGDSLITAVMENDMETIFKSGVPGLLKLVTLTHSGMTTDDFDQLVLNWVDTATHPITRKRYTEMVYQPMIEVMEYLRSNNFDVYIVSGGGIDFMRPWTGKVYGVEAQNVIGSSLKLKYVETENGPVIQRLPELDFIDDKEEKPVGIQRHIGKRPIAAFGNSDGDLQMLQWTDAGKGEQLLVYIHHTDSVREWAYDRNSSVGRLDKGLEIAQELNWTVVDMQKEWERIYSD